MLLQGSRGRGKWLVKSAGLGSSRGWGEGGVFIFASFLVLIFPTQKC